MKYVCIPGICRCLNQGIATANIWAHLAAESLESSCIRNRRENIAASLEHGQDVDFATVVRVALICPFLDFVLDLLRYVADVAWTTCVVGGRRSIGPRDGGGFFVPLSTFALPRGTLK